MTRVTSKTFAERLLRSAEQAAEIKQGKASAARTTEKLAPIHPGEVLLEDFLAPMGLSQYRLARDISVPPGRINEIVHSTRAITADTALRLARYFGTTERFWLNLQTRYDLEVQREKLGSRLAEEVIILVRSAA
jgi:antitoxin HigA-1